jgi:hypothetical protein
MALAEFQQLPSEIRSKIYEILFQQVINNLNQRLQHGQRNLLSIDKEERAEGISNTERQRLMYRRNKCISMCRANWTKECRRLRPLAILQASRAIYQETCQILVMLLDQTVKGLEYQILTSACIGNNSCLRLMAKLPDYNALLRQFRRNSTYTPTVIDRDSQAFMIEEKN